MALTQSITDLECKAYPLFGLLFSRSVMTQKLNLGNRTARAANDSWLMQKGEEIRGHEFHYSVWEKDETEIPPAYHLFSPRPKARKLVLYGHPMCISLFGTNLNLPYVSSSDVGKFTHKKTAKQDNWTTE